jgi:hypothetical protein
MARDPKISSLLTNRSFFPFRITPDIMILSLSFVTLVLAGMAVASAGRDVHRRDLGVRQSLEPVQCSDDTEAEFISDS